MGPNPFPSNSIVTTGTAPPTVALDTWPPAETGDPRAGRIGMIRPADATIRGQENAESDSLEMSWEDVGAHVQSSDGDIFRVIRRNGARSGRQRDTQRRRSESSARRITEGTVMPPSPRPRTLLAFLLVQREWTVEQFRASYADAATSIYGKPHDVADRTAKRWVAGAVARPHPVSRRVLETMFGIDTRALLGPPSADRDGPLVAHGIPTAALTGDDDDVASAMPGEVSPVNRRELIGAGVLLTAAGTTHTAADRASKISLAQLQRGIERLTGMYAVTPHAELVAPIESAWDNAEALLGTRVAGRTRRDLELTAGQYAFYRGQLAFDMGEDDTALTFLILAGQHADVAGDKLLAGSVAVMRSAIAFFGGHFIDAATIAQRAQPGAHPYIVPTLASSLARSLAKIGDAAGTKAALRTMRDNVWEGDPLPGPESGNEETYEAFSAVALGYLGRGDEAELHARNSLTLLTGTDCYVQMAGTTLALARALIHRSRADPEQAVGAIRDALRIVDGKGHVRTTKRATAIYRQMAARPDWARLPAVRDLGATLADRKALPRAANSS
jgi:hypothetical protein